MTEDAATALLGPGAPVARLDVDGARVVAVAGGCSGVLGRPPGSVVGQDLDALLRGVEVRSGDLPTGTFQLADEPERWVELTSDATTPSVLWITDATVRRTSAAAAATRSERFEMVLEGTRLGMWDWNPQTDDVVFDERWAEMLGHTLDEIPFELESWSSRVHPDDLEECFADITRHMTGEVAFYENVHRMRHKDGHWVHILDRGRIMERDADGNPIRFTGTHTDITAQREAEFAAQAANRAKSSFLANMSHEIRTPLNAVLGYAQVLLRDPHLTEEQDRYLSAIRTSGDHLLRLIDDVLTMSRIEAARVDLAEEDLSVGSLVHTAVDIVAPQARRLEVRVSGLAPGDAWVRTDAGKLRQIVVNLLGNAAKFAASRVEVLVSESTVDGRATLAIEVHDDGHGVPADQHDTIFDAFGQTEEGTAAGGTGLGLAISREFAELLGGSLTVDRSPLGGAAFRLSITAPTAAPTTDHLDVTALGSLAPGSPVPRILVVDDDAVNRDVLSSLLRSVGCRVRTANDGDDALTACRGAEVDLVLTDLRMPRRDGVALAEALAADPDTSQLPVVIVSASALDGDRERAFAAGVEDFLTKPFRADDILRCVEQLTSAEFTNAGSISTVAITSAEVAAVVTNGEAADLTDACASGDVERLELLVDAIAERDLGVGMGLRALVEAYDHESLLALLPSSVVTDV